MTIFGFIAMIMAVIDRFIVPLIFAIAFLVFLWGVYEHFILGAANEEKRKEGAKYALAGIIGFTIMIAVWGIVGLLVNSLGFDTRSRPPLPTFGGPGGYGVGGGNIYGGGQPGISVGSTPGGGIFVGASGSVGGGSTRTNINIGTVLGGGGRCALGMCNPFGQTPVCGSDGMCRARTSGGTQQPSGSSQQTVPGP